MKKSARLTYIWHRILMGIVFIVSLLGVVLNDDQSVKSDYLFNCAQSGMFLIFSLVPVFLKKLKLDVPDFFYIVFIVFCLAHFFLGEILGFFVIFKWWDSVLHTFSGMLIALLSFSLISLLNNHLGNFKLNMGFAILFAFSLSVTIGVIWEIIEFTADTWFGLNMQRAYVSTLSGRGEPFLGQAALADTMKDLILDSIGAGFVCLLCGIGAYKKRISLEDLSFIKRRVKVEPVTNESVDFAAITTGEGESVEPKEMIPIFDNESKEIVVEENSKIEEKPKTTKKKSHPQKVTAKKVNKNSQK